MGLQQRMMGMLMGRKSTEDTRRMMLDMMPGMMDSCFSSMDTDRRLSMLAHCRGMLDEMEAKYVEPAQPA